ncbi:DUF4157 domain-containing protein [Mucilaginibacter sp. OK098]|uniref:eCIS core domain-containing protein n=1 Tax=Mucilaginibacter sp. OK098 TaxID=1855297 RepID=UPI00091D7931|nr:DUF4157 domain-containing protein [Mucilaginibacter sp. OK098]SHN27339.1 protein of unknown function [Mucilaginibacter sp. OK098]
MHENTQIAHQPQATPAALDNIDMPVPELSDLEPGLNQWLPIQLKLAVGAPDDPLEYEADAMADKVMRMPETSFIQRKSGCSCGDYDDEHVRLKPLASQITPFIQTKGDGAGAVSDAVSGKIQSSMGGGSTMQADTKSFMESRFGTDFSDVKIHNGGESAELNTSLNAKAFTVSNNIYFNSGQYQPETDSGRHLLAHELTHVVQQGGSIQRKIIQKQVDPKSAGDKYYFRVKVPSVMNVEEWKAYIDMQIFHKRTGINWNGKGMDAGKLLTQDDVGKTVPVSVTKTAFRQVMGIQEPDPNAPIDVYATDDKTKEKIDAEIEKRFSGITGIPEGADGGKGDWQQGLKDDLRKNLENQFDYLGGISRQARRIVDYKNYTYKDYERLIQIYKKLALLSPVELEDYLNKVNQKTDDLSKIEESIDRFLAERQQQGENTKRREVLKAKLLFLDSTFDLYVKYKVAMRVTINQSGQALSNIGQGDQSMSSPPMMPIMDVQQAEKDLLANLKANGFDSIPDFEKLVDDYEKELLLRAKEIAFDILAKYEHFLFEAEEKYKNQAPIDALFNQLQPARASYAKGKVLQAEAKELSEQARFSTVQGAGHVANEKNEESSKKVNEGIANYQQAKDVLSQITGSNPLFLDKEFKRESLLSATSKEDLQSVILTYIRGRKTNIKDTRENIEKDPLLIYKLDSLMNEVYKVESMNKNSIYAKIIQFKNEERKFDQLELTLAITLFALALGVLTFGGGTVAVLAGGASLAISTSQALDELEKYNIETAAYGAQLLSEEPSMGWVIVSFVAAGIDLAAVSAATVKLIAAAAKELKTTEEVGSALSKFKNSLDQIPGLDEKLKQALIRGAEAEARLPGLTAKYDEALLQFNKIKGRLYSGIDPTLVYRFSRLAYYRLRKGIVSFEIFFNELKVKNIVTGVETADEIKALKQGYIDAVEGEAKLAELEKIYGKSNVRAVNDTVNVGGGLESQSEKATNLNPVNPDSGGPSRGIPNHIKAGFEDIGEIFKPGSLKKVYSNRLRYMDVDWARSASGAAKAMAPGAKLSLNVWTHNEQEIKIILDAFKANGFKNMQALGESTYTIIMGNL